MNESPLPRNHVLLLGVKFLKLLPDPEFLNAFLQVVDLLSEALVVEIFLHDLEFELGRVPGFALALLLDLLFLLHEVVDPAHRPEQLLLQLLDYLV